MGKFNELPFKAQFALIIALAAGLTAAFYFLQLKGIGEANESALATLKAKQRENAELRPFRDRERELEMKIASLQQQLAILQAIVPDEKEAEGFMHLVQSTAEAAGIEVRRYTARPTSTKEFYSEMPFEVDIDGPYYSVLNFFERVAKLERIINIHGLQMASVKKPQEAKVKKMYQYAAGESVVATCVATTFFSHDRPAQANPATPTAAPAPAAK
jgi:type IV pilus assembly protein PilO